MREKFSELEKEKLLKAEKRKSLFFTLHPHAIPLKIPEKNYGSTKYQKTKEENIQETY